MSYKSPAVGHEISCVFYGVKKKILNDSSFLEKTLSDALKKEKFTLLDVVTRSFKPQGFTIMILLAESHASLHTYPEHSSIYFNLYSCRSDHDGIKTYNILKSKLNPKEVDWSERKVVVKV